MRSGPLQSRYPSVLVTLVALALGFATLAPTAHASASDPEIMDATQDVSPTLARSVLVNVQDAERVAGNQSLYDLDRAYVAGESQDRLYLALRVVDLDGGLTTDTSQGTEAANSAGADTSQAGEMPATPKVLADFELRFDADGAPFVAVAALQTMEGEDGTPRIVGSLDLWDASGSQRTHVTQLAGSIDHERNEILFDLCKCDLGTPADGTMLTKFYAVSLAAGIPMDFAPDANLPTLDPENLDAEALLTAAPNYGRSYEFGSYRGPTQFAFSALDGTSFGAATGVTQSAVFTLENTGDREANVLITTQGPNGWAIKPDVSQVALQPGANRFVTVQLTPSSSATDGLLIVRAADSEGGFQREVAVQLDHQSATSGGASGGGGAGSNDQGLGGTIGSGAEDAPEQTLGQEGDTSEDTPALGLVATLLLFAFVAMRRRRAD